MTVPISLDRLLQPHPTDPPQVPQHFNLRFLINRQFEGRCNEIPVAIANRGKLHGQLNKTNLFATGQCRDLKYVARDLVPHLVCATQHSVAQLSAVISPLTACCCANEPQAQIYFGSSGKVMR
jgi:hypothetical protein